MVNKQDDEEIIWFFENFEKALSKSKADVNWFETTDFRVFSEYLIDDIKEIKAQLENPENEYLYYACQHIFNIQDWVKLIVEDAGQVNFGTAWETLFEKQFGDKHILQSLYDVCFERWVAGKVGQHQIGENFYNIIDGRLYYRNRFRQWFEVDRKTAFDLKPIQKTLENNDTIERLNREYKDTRYDLLQKRWGDKKYQGTLPESFLNFSDKETDPDVYFAFALEQAKKLLENPVPIEELERWYGGEITDLEHIVKVASFVLETVNKRRAEDSHTLYLLRDCLMFQEAHKVLDILEGEDTSSDQVLIGRKLLSHKPGHWGYYIVMLDSLYNAHLRYPGDFTKFYNEYARLMDLFVTLNPKFSAVVVGLADYIKQHILTDKKKIVIFDIGFQGSINLLIKYIIDRHINPSSPVGKVKTDIKIGVGAQWSKELFGYRYDSDYFPMLNRVQLMARSNELYQYKDGSLNRGKLRVTMGDGPTQRKAAIELAVLVMVAQIT